MADDSQSQNQHRFKSQSREAKKAYYEKNKSRILANAKKRYHEDPKKFHARHKKWLEENPEARKRIAREWAPRNKETLEQWRLSNPDKIRVYRSVSKANRRIRVSQAEGSFTKSDIDRIFKAQRGKCAYCRRVLNRYHIDHIVALVNGGSNAPGNLQLCCEDCNYSKNARDPIEFAQSTGRLL